MYCTRHPARRRQEGVALLSVLLIVAIISTTVSWILYAQNLAIQRTSQIIAHEQGRIFLLSLETFAKTMLEDDYRLSPSLDSYPAEEAESELWAVPKRVDAKYFSVLLDSDIQVSWCIYDAQSFLNVNNLVASSSTDTKVSQKWYAKRMLALLEQKEVESPEVILDSLLDWLDADDIERKWGAEGARYSFADPSYQAANFKISSIYELDYVRGIGQLSKTASENLIKNLIALPDFRITPININTATQDLLDAMPLPEGIGGKQIKAHIDKDGPFVDLAAVVKFLSQNLPENREMSLNWVNAYLDVKSNFFLLVGKVTSWGGEQGIISMLYRSVDREGKVFVVQRHYGINPYEDLKTFGRGQRCFEPTTSNIVHLP